MNIVHCVWNFTLDGVAHQVVLQRKPFASYEILHNGKQVYKGEPSWLVLGLSHIFQVEEHKFEVGAVPGPYLMDYVLRVDGNFVYLNKSQEKVFSKNIAKNLEYQSDWEKLAKILGLKYQPHLESDYAFRHRIVGYFSKFPVVAGVGSKPMGNVSVPGFFIGIQHYPLDDEKIEQIKKSDSLKQFFKSVKTHQAHLEIDPSFTSIFVPFQGKINEMGRSTVIQDFLEMITHFLYPPHQKCQGNDCKNPFSKTLNFVIINGSPWLMCADCIAEIPNEHKKMEQEYRQAPLNLGRGVLYGAAVATIGAILLALSIIFFDRLAGVFAFFMYAYVFMAMDKAKMKRTLISVVLAGVISIFGVMFGVYLGTVGYALKEREIIFSLIELWNIFLRLIQSEVFPQMVFINIIGMVLYGFYGLYAQRQYLKQAFNPKVEVIKNLNRPE
ncbi:MAG: hypothetical protein L6461_06070 [Anaerolineae bacterium]|nr:hypothetical protein [Anaerolineae bacterium]